MKITNKKYKESYKKQLPWGFREVICMECGALYPYTNGGDEILLSCKCGSPERMRYVSKTEITPERVIELNNINDPNPKKLIYFKQFRGVLILRGADSLEDTRLHCTSDEIRAALAEIPGIKHTKARVQYSGKFIFISSKDNDYIKHRLGDTFKYNHEFLSVDINDIRV